MNIENVKKVIDKIESAPELWDQTRWHCGTKHCFFGWAQVLSGKKPDASTVRRDARMFLDLGYADGCYFSSGQRTLDEIKTLLIRGNRLRHRPDGYDRDGYDRAGYGRAGLDRDGLDRDGLDINNRPRQFRMGASVEREEA